ncbi:vitamin D3 receptor B-like [Babylonia areolata]|uniref:vitamin D3 receptor B-like n=1 Tax=Babylonia areolata TaxID=304850 RepID=UPI003FD0CA14
MADEDLPSEEQSSTHKRHRPKNLKICGVCGDRALGYNFNAVTCESCKAFFRRNAFKDSQIKCLFSGSCVIDLRTRRFCPACRINKCYEIGMKREMILDEAERKARMAKVQHNRARKQLSSTQSQTLIKTEPLDPDEEARVRPSSCHELLLSPSSSASSTHTPSSCHELLLSPSSSASSTHTPSSCHEPLLSPSSSASSTTHTDTSEKEFQPVPPHCFPSDPSMYRKLVEDEQMVINDFAMWYETTVAAMPDIAYSKPENYQNANDLVNNSEICVRQLIRFVKRLDDFRSLRQEDQIAALKGSVMTSLLLRSVAFYVVEKDAWLTAKGEIPTSILQEATGFGSLHSMHVSYCRSLKAIILNNFTLYALMQVMLIFQPDSPNLVDRELVSNLQDKYMGLLKHYLESKFSFEFAQRYFVAILEKVSDLKKLSEQHSRILLQVNPSQIEPLMLEILNLK